MQSLTEWVGQFMEIAVARLLPCGYILDQPKRPDSVKNIIRKNLEK